MLTCSLPVIAYLFQTSCIAVQSFALTSRHRGAVTDLQSQKALLDAVVPEHTLHLCNSHHNFNPHCVSSAQQTWSHSLRLTILMPADMNEFQFVGPVDPDVQVRLQLLGFPAHLFIAVCVAFTSPLRR